MPARRSDAEIEAFCRHFAEHGNKAAAVMAAFEGARAWGSDRASTRGWQLMRRPDVKARVEELRREFAAPDEKVRQPDDVLVAISLDDLRLFVRAIASAKTDARLRTALARLVADALFELGRRSQGVITPVDTASKPSGLSQSTLSEEVDHDPSP